MKCQSCGTKEKVSEVAIQITVHLKNGTTRVDDYTGKQCPRCRERTLRKLKSAGATVDVKELR